jgi:hypothetical protein
MYADSLNERFAAGSIIRLAYGHTVNSFEDPYLVTARRTTKAAVEGASSAMLVDFFPLCECDPFSIKLTS